MTVFYYPRRLVLSAVSSRSRIRFEGLKESSDSLFSLGFEFFLAVKSVFYTYWKIVSM